LKEESYFEPIGNPSFLAAQASIETGWFPGDPLMNRKKAVSSFKETLGTRFREDRERFSDYKPVWRTKLTCLKLGQFENRLVAEKIREVRGMEFSSVSLR
jgi:hypothetical protein